MNTTTDRKNAAIEFIADLYNVSIDTAVMLYSDEIDAYERLLDFEEKEDD